MFQTTHLNEHVRQALGASCAGLPMPDAAWFLRPDGRDGSGAIHGVGHTFRVMIHGFELAQELGVAAWEREAVVRAALWHDIGRTFDGGDHFHGGKSAVVGLGLHAGLEPLVVETALHAATYHCVPDRYGEETARFLPGAAGALRVFQILKDADALDRVRFGSGRLDERQLRLAASRGRLERACELVRLVEKSLGCTHQPEPSSGRRTLQGNGASGATAGAENAMLAPFRRWKGPDVAGRDQTQLVKSNSARQ
jgi:hypothetical protein